MGESLKTGGPWEREKCKRNSIFYSYFQLNFKEEIDDFWTSIFFFENFLKGRIDVKNRVTDSHSDGEARSCCLCGSAAAAAAAAPTE